MYFDLRNCIWICRLRMSGILFRPQYVKQISKCEKNVALAKPINQCTSTNTRRDDHRSIQYTPRNMHTVFALLCFVVVIYWLIFPYPSGLLHRHCGNLTIAPVLAKQPWWIWINTSCEFIMKDYITTTKQSTTKPCAYFLGYTVEASLMEHKEVIILHIWYRVCWWLGAAMARTSSSMIFPPNPMIFWFGVKIN